jgi:YHS domain
MALRRSLWMVAALLLGAPGAWAALGQPERSPRDALQPFNELIGSWRGTATPSGTKEEQQRNFWQETIAWEWQFKDKDAWIKIDIAKGKHFAGGTLRYIPAKDHFEMVMTNLKKESKTYVGTMKDKVLTMECTEAGRTDRLVFTLLHADRFLYRQEVRKAEGGAFAKLYSVGATKEGTKFAAGDGKPECIVSGGLGTMPVNYQGKTYYVCCGGCRDEFNADPQKYVKEYEAKKKAK